MEDLHPGLLHHGLVSSITWSQQQDPERLRTAGEGKSYIGRFGGQSVGTSRRTVIVITNFSKTQMILHSRMRYNESRLMHRSRECMKLGEVDLNSEVTCRNVV